MTMAKSKLCLFFFSSIIPQLPQFHPQQFTVMSWKPAQWQPLRITAIVIQNLLAVAGVCSSPHPSGHFPFVATEPVQPKHDQIERAIQNDRGLLKCTLPMFISQQQPAVYPTNLKFIGCNCEAWWSLPQCVTEDTAFFKKNMHLHLHHVGTESLMVL